MTWYLPFKISIAKTDVFAIECLDQMTSELSGLADHDFVVAKFCLKAPLPRKPPREVYKWEKVDETIFKRQVKELATNFMDSSPEGRTTEENWQLLKNGLQDITSKNVPTKTIRGTSNAPWFTQAHKK